MFILLNQINVKMIKIHFPSISVVAKLAKSGHLFQHKILPTINEFTTFAKEIFVFIILAMF